MYVPTFYTVQLCVNLLSSSFFSDVDVDKPDEKSVMTYVAQFLKHLPDPHNAAGDAQETDVCS